MRNEKFDRLYAMAMKELTENLMPWWMTHAADAQTGYFHAAVRNDNMPINGANHFIVLSARLIWTFASCYRVLGDEQYLLFAKRAYDWFIQYFIDEEFGGAYTSISAAGDVVDPRKLTYGNSFAIYGLAEYHRATGDEQALGHAKRIVQMLEAHVYDPIHKGYFECSTRDWRVDPWMRGMNRLPTDEKTMNTHLHLLESYTCLLRSDDSLRSKVREHLYVMLNRIVNRDIHHYHVFQDRAWNPTTQDISYGHDIEGSWLMMETAQVLGEPEAQRVARDTCINIARACLAEGLREDGAMLTEYDPIKRQATQRISWWEQCEAVVGFLNAWEATGEECFLDASIRSFQLIDCLFVDHTDGGWFAVLHPDGTPSSTDKCNGYTCPYHNARMCLEIIERYRRMETGG